MIKKLDKILLVGAGYMGREYAKVLKAQGVNFTVVGRSQESAKSFKNDVGLEAISGGIKKWLRLNPPHSRAIVAVTEDQLGIVTKELLNAGCKTILVEKPGGFNAKEIVEISEKVKKIKAKVYVGYNRRFYTSVQKALEIIKQDGGIRSFNFDFTERSYVIEVLKQSPKIKKEWFLHNSTHVIDLAFFMADWPKKMSCYKRGGVEWHPTGSIYSGAGVSESGALFSYHADWESAGCWSLEIMTPKNKLIFRPLEKLQIQKYGNMAVEELRLDDKLDIKFKPGLYLQVEAFLQNQTKLLRIEEQVRKLEYYRQINGDDKKS